MEEGFPCSLSVCRFIVQSTIFEEASKRLPPSKSELNLYSYKKSARITEVMLTTKHSHDYPATRLSEDDEIKKQKSNSFKIHNIRKPSATLSVPDKKDSPGCSFLHIRLSSGFNRPGLVPLGGSEGEEGSDEEGEEDGIEDRMRDVKAQQENVRTRYMENLRPGIKRSYTKHNQEGKISQKPGIYDYDGSLIEPLKAESIRFPAHFLDLEVQVQSTEQNIGSLYKIAKKKAGKSVLFEAFSKNKEDLGVSESVFLNELTNIQWAEGVSVSPKEEDRKAWGSQPQKPRKRKLDILKPSEELKHMSLADLQNYRGIVNCQSSTRVNLPSEKKCVPGRSFFAKDTAASTGGGQRTIKIANDRALQFLITESVEEPAILSKKSRLARSQKRTACFE